MTDENRIKCKSILNYYGEEAQKRKIIEETAELIVAILHDDHDNYIEELADTSIVLEQLILSLSQEDYVNFIKTQNNKLNRQLRRMAKERDDYEKEGETD